MSDERIPTRRISFDDSLADLPKHFAVDGDLIASHLMATLSGVFPDGEDFFVRSVRRFRDQIDDPLLKRRVAGFIGQEAMHGREHRALNRRLDALGYPTRRVERCVKVGVAIRERVLTGRANLAATAALEHFTATLAEVLLEDEDARNLVAHPGARDMFLWHALEESEHKAVAFDVYRAVGGSERTRVVTMKVISYGFILGVSLQVGISLLGDRATYQQGRLTRSWRQLRSSPFANKAVWQRLQDYNRPDFHPDDYDAASLIERWRTELFGEHGALTGQLQNSRDA